MAPMHPLRRRRGTGLVLAVLSAALIGTGLSACSSGGGDDRAAMAAAEARWGGAPGHPAGVAYQPDVEVLEKGPLAVRAQSDNGIEWTLDKRIEGVKDIEEGKIAYLSGRVVGRVLRITDEGDQRKVILGPVQLTDVYKELDINGEQPLDPSKTTMYAAPEFPSEYDNDAAGGPGRALPMPRQVSYVAAKDIDSKFYGGSDGIGVTFHYDKGGVKFTARGLLKLKAPRVVFDLKITNGKLVTAVVRLEGAGGLQLSLDGATKVGLANVAAKQRLPIDLSISVASLLVGVPFAVVFSGAFFVQTVFSAKDARLNAQGSYGFSGALGFGYQDGGLKVSAPSALTTQSSIIRSMNGVSVGVNALIMGVQFRTMVGIGAFGFATGPYFGFNASVGITRGSDLGLILCKGATLSLAAVAGIGYQVPELLTKGINALLRALSLKTIESGGEKELYRATLITKSATVPKVPLCDDTAAPS